MSGFRSASLRDLYYYNNCARNFCETINSRYSSPKLWDLVLNQLWSGDRFNQNLGVIRAHLAGNSVRRAKFLTTFQGIMSRNTQANLPNLASILDKLRYQYCHPLCKLEELGSIRRSVFPSCNFLWRILASC